VTTFLEEKLISKIMRVQRKTPSRRVVIASRLSGKTLQDVLPKEAVP